MPKLSMKSNIGLDIGSSSIKAVELVTKNQGFELVHYGIKEIPAEAEEAALAGAIKELWQENRFSSQYVNTSVAGQEVVVRYLDMPVMKKEELKSAIRFEAEKYIPFNIDDMNLDFQILETKAAASQMRVLLVAAKKSRIERIVRILKQAGLTPKLVDVDSFAILNTFQLCKIEEKETIAVLDIGSRLTNIIVAGADKVYLTRDILIAGEEIRKALSTQLGMTPEKIKDCAQFNYEELFHGIKNVIDNFVSEVRMSFNFCENQLESPIKNVYLTGGSSLLKCFDLYLGETLGMPVSLWNPLMNVSVKPDLPKEKLGELASKLTVAIGLAMRG